MDDLDPNVVQLLMCFKVVIAYLGCMDPSALISLIFGGFFGG